MNQALLGWIDFDQRTNEQNDVHDSIVAAMASFSLFMGKPEKGFKFILTDFWSAPKVIHSLGKPYLGIHQLTGSCVWAGFQNAAQTLNFIEVCKNNEPEEIKFAFLLYNYGRSRFLANMRGRGEGSLGSTMARSAEEDGYVDSRDEELNLPVETYGDGILYSKDIEFQWSDGTFAPQRLRDKAKNNRFISAPVDSAEAIRAAILNGYTVTRAHGRWVEPGSAEVKDGALIGRYNGSGGHQESILGYWNHPIRGELFYEMNQWGRKAYGTDPGGGALGGCWVSIDDVQAACEGRYAEHYALSSNEGFVKRPEVFDWARNSFVS